MDMRRKVWSVLMCPGLFLFAGNVSANSCRAGSEVLRHFLEADAEGKFLVAHPGADKLVNYGDIDNVGEYRTLIVDSKIGECKESNGRLSVQVVYEVIAEEGETIIVGKSRMLWHDWKWSERPAKKSQAFSLVRDGAVWKVDAKSIRGHHLKPRALIMESEAVLRNPKMPYGDEERALISSNIQRLKKVEDLWIRRSK